MLLPLNARTPKARMAGGRAARSGRQTGGQATYVPEEGGCEAGRTGNTYAKSAAKGIMRGLSLSLSHCETRAIYQPSLLLLLLLFVEDPLGRVCR